MMPAAVGGTSLPLHERFSPRKFIDLISDLVFGYPGECALCGDRLPQDRKRRTDASMLPNGWTVDICPHCLDSLARERSSVCKICGTPLRQPLTLCPDCLRNLYNFDAQRSAGRYEGFLKDAILRMKYRGERWLARPLGALVAWVALEFMPVDFIIPVPLDPGSSIRRGHNQALDLANEAGALLEVPVIDILKRQQRYHHQAGLERKDRWANLRASMNVKTEMRLSGLRLLLVDDVATTGATLDEAARVLKRMGASEVFCATVAKTTRR